MSADIRRNEGAHPGPKHQESPLHAQKGYETLDAQAGATYRAGFYILGIMFAVALLLVPMYWLLARRETRAQQPAATVIREQPQEAAPSFPRLVTSEPAVLEAFRRQEDELLNGYGWVEKDRGIARMPIAEAVRLVGERGSLPAFPAAPVAQAPGPGGPPPAVPAASPASPPAAPGSHGGTR